MFGTVDKFQGREAPVVFYSMATSSAGDVPRNALCRFVDVAGATV